MLNEVHVKESQQGRARGDENTPEMSVQFGGNIVLCRINVYFWGEGRGERKEKKRKQRCGLNKRTNDIIGVCYWRFLCGPPLASRGLAVA